MFVNQTMINEALRTKTALELEKEYLRAGTAEGSDGAPRCCCPSAPRPVCANEMGEQTETARQVHRRNGGPTKRGQKHPLGRSDEAAPADGNEARA